MSKYLSVIIAIIIGILLGAGGVWYYNNQSLLESQPESETEIQQSKPKIINKVNLKKDVSAWLVWWDQQNGFQTFQKYGGLISNIKPFWYQLDSSGKIIKYNGAEDQQILEFAKTNDIDIIPTLCNDHKPDPVSKVINYPDKKSAHIKDIVKLIESNDYDGIEIDYESLYAKDRDAYSSFMTDLAKALDDKNKLLTTALHAKTQEPGSWEGPQAQDWKTLGQVVDKVKIMCYDFHWETSQAGAVAPLDWTEDVIKFAISQIPIQKIDLGVPFYGYDWVDKIGQGITWNEVQTILKVYSPKTLRDSTSGEPNFKYQISSGEQHEVWYNDNQSLAKRLDLVIKYDLAGIGIWRLGQEDPKNFDQIETKFKNGDGS